MTVAGPPPPPTPGCEEPAGVLKIRTGNFKNRFSWRSLQENSRFSSLLHMLLPLPLPPPDVMGGGGMKRGVYSLSHLKGRLHRFEQFWDIPYERLEDY